MAASFCAACRVAGRSARAAFCYMPPAGEKRTFAAYIPLAYVVLLATFVTMQSLYDYLLAVLPYWWVLMGAFPFIVDDIIVRVWPAGKRRLDALLEPTKRRRITITLMVLGVFVAGFLAFKDEHQSRREAEEKLSQYDPNTIIALQTELREMRDKYAELEKRVAGPEPRSIDAAEANTFELALKSKVPTKSKVRVTCMNNDEESCGFAEQILAAINRSGWPVEEAVRPFLVFGNPIYGVKIKVRTREADGAGELQRALAAIGINGRGELHPALEEGVIEVVVGRQER